MRIAILGATSRIAKDLIRLFSLENSYELVLFARRPQEVSDWMSASGIKDCYPVCNFRSFKNDQHLDALINFVGVGDPAAAQSMGAAILDVTHEFDALALNYVRKNPGTRYLFLSSGAVYGGGFAIPADDQTHASFPINQLGAHDWYGMAKVYAETRHRALPELPIVDLRVFNYFSQSSDIEARFLITDILRSIRAGQVLQTSHENIVRDYIGPKEFMQLILKVLMAPPQNAAIDFFTQAPVDKISMLERMQKDLGLRYALVEQPTGLLATGGKLNYYSKSRKATDLFGYSPEATSLDVVLEQSRCLLSHY
jgi:nucleoside-diphosphate-sugar epimerase